MIVAKCDLHGLTGEFSTRQSLRYANKQHKDNWQCPTGLKVVSETYPEMA